MRKNGFNRISLLLLEKIVSISLKKNFLCVLAGMRLFYTVFAPNFFYLIFTRKFLMFRFSSKNNFKSSNCLCRPPLEKNGEKRHWSLHFFVIFEEKQCKKIELKRFEKKFKKKRFKFCFRERMTYKNLFFWKTK